MHLKYQNEDYMTLSRTKMKLNMKPKVKSSKVQHLIILTEWHMMKILPEGSGPIVGLLQGNKWINLVKYRSRKIFKLQFL